MIHFAQYPTVKVPVKLNAVNFDGVFNNIKAYAEAQGMPQVVGSGPQANPQINSSKNPIGIVGNGIGISGIGIGYGAGQVGGNSQMHMLGNNTLGSDMGSGGTSMHHFSSDFSSGASGQGFNNSRLDQNDRSQNSRRPSTKNNAVTSSQSTGAGSSQASISQKDKQGFSALAGVPKTHYGAGGGINSANLRPPISGQ